MAPEYALHGIFSVRSDIFSFGVLLLELVSGQKNSSFRDIEDREESLLTYVSANTIPLYFSYIYATMFGDIITANRVHIV